jgi:7-keto-8-aminopelargonate synthetase-like enzyme
VAKAATLRSAPAIEVAMLRSGRVLQRSKNRFDSPMATPELQSLQRGLAARIQATIARAAMHGVPLADTTHSPVFFVECKSTEKAFSLATSLRQEGFCVCASMFPIVRRNHAGIRFTISHHNEISDIEALMSALAMQVKRLGLEPPSARDVEQRA